MKLQGSRPSIFRRRLEGRTDFRRRARTLLGRFPLLVPRVSNRNVVAQIASPKKGGDQTVASAHSRELLRFGWKGSRKSLPAAYLVGFLVGARAKKKGVEEAVLYMGVKPFTPRSRSAAVLKGCLDAGLRVRADSSQLPNEEQLQGHHIAEYGRALKKAELNVYRARFRSLLASGLEVEDYPRHFQEVKAKIAGEAT